MLHNSPRCGGVPVPRLCDKERASTCNKYTQRGHSRNDKSAVKVHCEQAGTGHDGTDVKVDECHLREKSLVLLGVNRSGDLSELQTENMSGINMMIGEVGQETLPADYIGHARGMHVTSACNEDEINTALCAQSSLPTQHHAIPRHLLSNQPAGGAESTVQWRILPNRQLMLLLFLNHSG